MYMLYCHSDHSCVPICYENENTEYDAIMLFFSAPPYLFFLKMVFKSNSNSPLKPKAIVAFLKNKVRTP